MRLCPIVSQHPAETLVVLGQVEDKRCGEEEW